MDGFKKICSLDDLPERRGVKFSVDEDTEAAVFRIGDKVYAVSNLCPHNHTTHLYEGFIDENLNLACPIHGWLFCLETGKTPETDQGYSGKLETFKTVISEGEVYLEVKKKKFRLFNWA